MYTEQVTAPSFPSFRNFDTRDKSWYTAYYEKFDPYADFYFGNLLTWLNINDDLEISQLNGNVVFRFTDVFSRSTLAKSYTLFGDSHADKTMHSLVTNTPDSSPITMIPECFVSRLSKFKDKVVENRDNWDYVYDVSEFVALDGPNYRRVRYQINAFDRLYGKNAEVDISSLDSAKQGAELIRQLKGWGRAYQYGNDPEEIEDIALQKRLISLSGAGSHVLRLKMRDRTEGFVIFTFPINKSSAIIHHIKCSYKYEHMFDHLFFETMRFLRRNGIRQLNLEQDLGIGGLREHKMLLRPSGFLKKYSLER
jgi:hypothetical protein